MKRMRDYLNLDESELRFLDAYDALPQELLPLFEKMLSGSPEEFDQAEQELRAIAQSRGKLKK